MRTSWQRRWKRRVYPSIASARPANFRRALHCATMPDFAVGPLRFEVEHRNPGADGGPTLRVRDERGREWLRFDCFAKGGHWHLDAGGRDEVTLFADGFDSIAWTFAQLRADLAGLLARAGLAVAA